MSGDEILERLKAEVYANIAHIENTLDPDDNPYTVGLAQGLIDAYEDVLLTIQSIGG